MNGRDFFFLHQRRRFLRQSAFGLGTVALADLLTREGRTAGRPEVPNPLRPRRPHFAPRAKSVICIFMAGGPSHLDLFDPKPVLHKLSGKPVPESFLKNLADPVIKGKATVMASPRTFCKHGQCGMEFSDFVPHLASRADDLCMVRSVFTTNANHDPGQLLFQCGTPLFGHPSMGAWVTYGLGSESQELPGFVVLLSNSGKGVDAGTALWGNGFLPSSYRGVTLRTQGGDPILHLSNPAGVSLATQKARLAAIGDLNRLRQEQTGDPEIASRLAAYELAYRMQAAAPELVGLSKETAAIRRLYGLDDDKTRWFGANCLLARRLVERGVRFVQLYHSTWDDHYHLEHFLRTNTAMTDRPAAALLTDLKQRGLLDQTLVIWGGEFGRTPMIEVRRGITPGKEGRDHHPFGFTVLLAGGGIKGGQIVGQTDELGYQAVADRVHIHDLQATILHCLGLDHTRLTYRHQGRDSRLTDVAGQVVPKLLV
jgi:hypothetical protein